MGTYLDKEMLANFISKKRGSRTLRDASIESNISASTLSRVENGATPDIETFLLICDWLEVPPCLLFGNTEDIKLDAREAISVQIRSDPNLDPAIATVLLTLIKAAYSDLSHRKS
jgi:transcriptional regulator with XRE-family HTH domain